MILADRINSKEVIKAYLEFLDSPTLNFANYWNWQDKNQVKEKLEQRNYLISGNINFGRKTNSLISELTHEYTYNRDDIGEAPDELNIGTDANGYAKAEIQEEVFRDKYKIIVYKYIWFENINGTELFVSIPNQANWNINIFIDENDGCLKINNNVE